MRKYFSTLHQKSDHHKKRFAFLISGLITLFIFGIWSVVNFGISNTSEAIVAEKKVEISPLQPLRENLASGFEALRNSFGQLKSGLETIDVKSKYKDLRDNALDVYAR